MRLQVWVWLIAASVLALPLAGCKGCSTNPFANRSTKAPDIDELEKKKKEKDKPKPDFEFKVPQVLPGEPAETRAFLKPGHWVTVRNIIKANNFDFQAELHTKSTDSSGRTLRVEDTDFQIVSARPAPLPKGQEKAIDTTYFVPIIHLNDPNMPRSVWLARELRTARGNRLVLEDVRQATVSMPAYQYFFVILAAEPERYSFLKPTPAFAVPTSVRTDLDKLVYYRVISSTTERVLPLPSHSLTWTSIAYVLWDDMSKGSLTPLQQQAMLDWLHWGGQLIVNGPTSLEKLRGTFLEPYLPATPGSSGEVSQTAIDEINKAWSLPDKRKNEPGLLVVPPGKAMPAIQLEKHAAANYVPLTGELVVERRVGSGRIVVTAFSLTDSRLLKWKGLDNFMNGAILRRPRREYRQADGLPDGSWADFDPSFAVDARLISTVRYFSRDIGHFSSTPAEMVGAWEPGESPSEDELDWATKYELDQTRPGRRLVAKDNSPASRPPKMLAASAADDWHFRGFPFRRNTGMAAWNDRSGASDGAREALKDAAGISIPRGEFVFKVLAIYLAVLAPLNWFVFRVMGRVEWAWIAAPFIAILGTFSVVRMAQLDIGFARSTTEIAVAEVHAGYPRAHMTRYVALYTSLSTSYDLEFADDGAMAQPFSAAIDHAARPTLRTTIHTVNLRRDRQMRLSGFFVPSNWTGYVHCEHVTDLGGSFVVAGSDVTGLRLQNGTTVSLHDAGVVRKKTDGRVEVAWLGDLKAKTTVPLKFDASQNGSPHFAQWDNSFVTLSYNAQAKEIIHKLDANKDAVLSRGEVRTDAALSGDFARLDQNRDGKWDQKELLNWCRQSRAGEVSLGQLIELATKALQFVPGEMRLVGWTDAPISGVTIRPGSAQVTGRTMFLVHLDPGVLPEPRSDLRLLSDVMEIRPDNEGETADQADKT